MKAVVFHHPKKVKVDAVPDPKIEAPTDIILGHEFMGIAEEVGSEIKHLKKGDRVAVPFPIGCGNCIFCTNSLPIH